MTKAMAASASAPTHGGTVPSPSADGCVSTARYLPGTRADRGRYRAAGTPGVEARKVGRAALGGASGGRSMWLGRWDGEMEMDGWKWV
jgi:hypothetical protein